MNAKLRELQFEAERARLAKKRRVFVKRLGGSKQDGVFSEIWKKGALLAYKSELS